MDASFRDWQELPPHIVDLLVLKLDSFSDYLHVLWVCPQWRHVAVESNVYHKVNLDVVKATRKKHPLLMFHTDENDMSRKLYSISDGKTYTLKLPLPYKRRFLGSSMGWLFYVDETMVVTLVNPYNNVCISLPVFEDPRKLFKVWLRSRFDFYITKGILISDPLISPDSFVVVVIYGNEDRIAFFTPGESSWNFLDLTDENFVAVDIISYKGKLYGVTLDAQLIRIDLCSRTFETIIQHHDLNVVSEVSYLVESQFGELLMVERFWNPLPDQIVNEEHDVHEEDQIVSEEHDVHEENYNHNGYNPYEDDVSSNSDLETRNPIPPSYRTAEDCPRTFQFKVFKMSNPTKEGPTTWARINEIGQQALFLGDNHSVSVSTTDFPRCLPNSIYYTSQHHLDVALYHFLGSDEDSGIFSLEDNICYHPMLSSDNKCVQPSIWFVPNPGEIN